MWFYQYLDLYFANRTLKSMGKILLKTLKRFYNKGCQDNDHDVYLVMMTSSHTQMLCHKFYVFTGHTCEFFGRILPL